MLLIYLILFIIQFLGLCCAKVSLFRLEGDVANQEFIYYKIMHPGNLLLVLESLEGDADIYVSEKTPAPTYHPDNYDIHSATCGQDSVTISKMVKRPMTVGVYGYSFHNKFSLEVFQLPDNDNTFSEDENTEKENIEVNEVKKSYKIKKKTKNLPNGLWPLFELFEMLFL